MNKIQKMFLCVAFLLTTTSFVLPIDAYAAEESVNPIQALKIYPSDIRAAIASVLQHPEVLLELEQYRQVVRAKFKELLAPYPQKTQETVRQLVPYRKLWRGLGLYLGSEKDTQELLKAYPKEIQNLAKYLLENNPDIIGKVASMEKETYQHFHQMLSGLDPQTQAAFRKVGEHSGIFSILSLALNLGAEEKPPSPELKQKSQNLANQLLALNKDGKSARSESNANSSDASATLDAAHKKFTEDLNRQIDQDPYSDNAIQATVGFSPNPYYGNSMGGLPYPYWY